MTKEHTPGVAEAPFSQKFAIFFCARQERVNITKLQTIGLLTSLRNILLVALILSLIISKQRVF